MPKNPSALYILLTTLVFTAGCSQEKSWKYHNSISIQEQVHPLGIAENNGAIWISAPDEKKIMQINAKGEVISQQIELERPMHITTHKGKIYAPLYLDDQVISLQNGMIDTLQIGAEPDAPAAVSARGNTMAIADFYNHRIILQTGEKTITFGEKGSGKGRFNYPTDVEITEDKIFVADAYNNRVQVFSREGKPEQTIGAQDSINVATGLSVREDQLFVTDFYNNRILIYDLNGKLIQTLSDSLNKPTDAAVIDDTLYVPNFGAYSVVRYVQR